MFQTNKTTFAIRSIRYEKYVIRDKTYKAMLAAKSENKSNHMKNYNQR
ncbi:unnamed protein product, partial [marine sediment metagenome]